MKEEIDANDFTEIKQVHIEDHHQTVVRERKLRTFNEYKKLLKSVVILEQATELTLGLNSFIDLMDFHVIKNLLHATTMGEIETCKRIVGVSSVYTSQGTMPFEATIKDSNTLCQALILSKEYTDPQSVYLWEIAHEKNELK